MKLLASVGDRFRVMVSGFDFSDRCFMADEEAGTAWCYRANMAGEFPVANAHGQPSIVLARGTVVIETNERICAEPALNAGPERAKPKRRKALPCGGMMRRG